MLKNATHVRRLIPSHPSVTHALMLLKRKPIRGENPKIIMPQGHSILWFQHQRFIFFPRGKQDKKHT